MRQHAADQYERVQIAGTVAAPSARAIADETYRYWLLL
jgi:hypothetical protein